MTTIAVDAMGCDLGLDATVEGAVQAVRDDEELKVVLVGDLAPVRARLREEDYDRSRIEVAGASQVITMDDSPKRALEVKSDASVLVAARLVAEGRADALVSAGNTGGVTLACAQSFQRLPGVRRCALGAVYPTEKRRGEKDDPFSLILDVGLTLEATADDLVAFALMGAAYSARISRNDRPRVALLSNGTEAHKGPAEIVAAHKRLALRDDIEFIGNIEGMDIPRGTADVVVTGGFLGNVVLKMLEGVSETVKRLAKYAVEKKLRYKAGVALLGPAVKALKQATDWQQYGGVPILGFDHLCIKAHGRSSARAIRNAIKVANRATASGLVEGIASAMVGELKSGERPLPLSVDVLFDIDGTLVRTYPIEDELYDRALRTIGLSLPTTDYQALGASTDVSILRVLARRAWQRDPHRDEVERVREAHTRGWSEQIGREGIEVVPGARGALSELRAAGVRFAAATGGFRVTASCKLAAAELDITIAAAAEDGRDRAELVAHAAGKHRPIYVGDGLWDADAAAENGLGFIGVAETRERAEAFCRASSQRRRSRSDDTRSRVVSDLTQLVEFLAIAK